MDEKLILTVFNFPELYNVTLPNYRSGDSRSHAWTRISALTGLQLDECKRKWKNLRDRYLKEVRQENRTKEQGELVPSRWKFRQLLNFLAPFSKSRNGTVSRDDDDPDSPGDVSETTEGDVKPVEMLKVSQSAITPTTQASTMSQLAFVTQLSPVSQGPQMAQLAFLAKLPPGAQISPVPQQSSGRKRSQPREIESPASPCSSSTSAKLPIKTKRLVKDVDATHTRARDGDEDELFLLSFVPALKRLAPQKRCETKMKIQQILYEAEFSVASPSDTQDHPDAEA
ncbi:uncharacterized protein [Osmerus mordax]|uniref:uncharacterized protein n=1 Tax=Osmerus mordax TaxID=8014 RepID=UPI00350EB24C